MFQDAHVSRCPCFKMPMFQDAHVMPMWCPCDAHVSRCPLRLVCWWFRSMKNAPKGQEPIYPKLSCHQNTVEVAHEPSRPTTNHIFCISGTQPFLMSHSQDNKTAYPPRETEHMRDCASCIMEYTTLHNEPFTRQKTVAHKAIKTEH